MKRTQPIRDELSGADKAVAFGITASIAGAGPGGPGSKCRTFVTRDHQQRLEAACACALEVMNHEAQRIGEELQTVRARASRLTRQLEQLCGVWPLIPGASRRSHFPLWPRTLELLQYDQTSGLHRSPVAAQSVDWEAFYDRLQSDADAKLFDD